MSYMNNENQGFYDEMKEMQEKIAESRREFFKTVGQGAVATAVATTAMHMGVRPYMKPIVEKASADAKPNGGWRNLFSLKPEYVYMNVGTTGSTPTQILDLYEKWYTDVSIDNDAYLSNNDYMERSVRSGNWGCNPHELIYTLTTSDGMNRLTYGQDWKSGDYVMTTNMEHTGGLGPLYTMKYMFNVDPGRTGRYRWVEQATGAPVVGANTADTDGQLVATSTSAVPTGAGVVAPVLVMFGDKVIKAPTGIRRGATAATTEWYGVPSYATYLKAKTPVASGGWGCAATSFDDFQFTYDWVDYVSGAGVSANPLKKQIDATVAARNATGKLTSFMFSSPPYLTGIRFPEKQICNYVDTLAGGQIRTFIDAAHLPGMININLHDMGCDLFAGSGHKWQCGPGQTGIAYIRNGVKGAKNNEWTFTVSSSDVRKGTSTEYSSSKALPKYWPMNSSYRVGLTGAGTLNSGTRNPTDNISSMVSAVGNNSIPLNRALFECVNLWNGIGRQAIDDYVVSLAQWLRMSLANLDTLVGTGTTGLYAMGVDFRKTTTVPTAGGAKLSWSADVLNAVDNRGDFPAAARIGLTPWNPFYSTGVLGGQPEYNTPLTIAQATLQNSRNSQVLTYLSAQYGLFIRNTRVPNQTRFGNAAADVGQTYSTVAVEGVSLNSGSTPFRVSSHLFHSYDDMDQLVAAFGPAAKGGAADATLHGMLKLS